MIKDFNLLISTSRRNEQHACSEAWYLLGELGDKKAEITPTGIIGLIVAKTILNPKIVIFQLREILREKPWEIRYILKVVPIEKVVKATLEEIEKEALNLRYEIGNNESYRITVQKRRCSLSSTEIIEAIAKHIDRKVNLTKPDKIFMVQILGDLAGLSILKPEEILSVEKEKRTL
ncbi:MAG: THUMP domain-containing protein [Candidatus Bathyarchaeia archaeon]|nr:THUMP domain-containing protein [Candidatus Bathyarchaeota archaeon]